MILDEKVRLFEFSKNKLVSAEAVDFFRTMRREVTQSDEKNSGFG